MKYNIGLNGKDIVSSKALGNLPTIFSPIISLYENSRKKKRGIRENSGRINRETSSLLRANFRRKRAWIRERINIALVHKR